MATAVSAPLGLLIRQYRQAAGLTQELLAERAGLSVRGLSNLERGLNSMPRRDTLERLIAALELSAAERVLVRVSVQPTQGGAPPGAAPSAGLARVPLVGRQEVLERLERHLAGEGPPLLLLAGEAGIGKTRLLQEIGDWAVAHGFTVLAGAAQRCTRELPYTPLLEMIRRYLRHQPPAVQRAALDGGWLQELLPELADGAGAPRPAAGTPEQHRRVFDAVARFMTNMAGPAGTLLALDDLQWAGPDALDLLAMLTCEAAASSLGHSLLAPAVLPLRIIGTCRDMDIMKGDALSTLINELAPAGLAGRHLLGALDPDAAAGLLDALLTGVVDVSAAWKEQVLRCADGVPFYLVSYAQGLRQRDPDAMAGAPPWDVRQSVGQRVVQLSKVADAVLKLAAILGKDAPRPLLVAAVSQPREDVYAGLDEACRAGLLAEDGAGTYHFTHDLIAEVVEASMGAAERAVLHQRVAELLEQGAGPDPDTRVLETLAYHYGRSDDTAKAACYLERAGDSALVQEAHSAAERLYREALVRLARTGRSLEMARVQHKLGCLLRLISQDHEEALALLAAASYLAADDRAEASGFRTREPSQWPARYSVSREETADALPVLRSPDHDSDAPADDVRLPHGPLPGLPADLQRADRPAGQPPSGADGCRSARRALASSL